MKTLRGKTIAMAVALRLRFTLLLLPCCCPAAALLLPCFAAAMLCCCCALLLLCWEAFEIGTPEEALGVVAAIQAVSAEEALERAIQAAVAEAGDVDSAKAMKEDAAQAAKQAARQAEKDRREKELLVERERNKAAADLVKEHNAIRSQ